MRGLVEHTVDESMTLLRAEFFGQLHRLVNGHLVRDIETIEKFVGGQPQLSPLSRVQFFGRTVNILGDIFFNYINLRTCVVLWVFNYSFVLLYN